MARAYYPSGSGYTPWTPQMVGTADSNGCVQAMSSSLTEGTLVDFCESHQSFAGAVQLPNQGAWYNLFSVRHRNNTGDGKNYGFYLMSPLTSNGPLTYRQHLGGTWGSERIIADTFNPEVAISSSQPTNPNVKIWVQI